MLQSQLDPEPTVAALHHDQFDAFYRAKWRDVYRALAAVLRDADLAQEAADEAMARAFQHWRSVQRMDNPAGWVYRVGLNWARSRIRRAQRERTGGAVATTREPEPLLVDPEIHAALATLPFKQREIVVLHYLLDLTSPRIAAMLDIPEGTVKSRLHRALDTLRREVSP
ncbi:MAG: sigma-70 family RNA polymerase sigma factor [Acidimicrobiia bacterium]|jgi:RNA polymerase sigma-70 factor (ECF subfamily)